MSRNAIIHPAVAGTGATILAFRPRVAPRVCAGSGPPLPDRPTRLLPPTAVPHLGLAGAFGWMMPPSRRAERVREMGGRLGVEFTAVMTGLTAEQVHELLREGCQ